MTVWHELWRWLVVAFPEIINTEEKLRKNKLNSFDKIRGRYVLNLLRVFSYICLSILLLTKTLHIPYLKRIIPLFKWHIDYIRRRLQHTQKFQIMLKFILKLQVFRWNGQRDLNIIQISSDTSETTVKSCMYKRSIFKNRFPDLKLSIS